MALAQLSIDDLDGSDGFVIQGIDPFDSVGRSVSVAGDINGDGFDDLIIGAPGAGEPVPDNPPRFDDNRGESYVVFGRNHGFAASIDLAELNGSDGFVLRGIDPYDRSGYSVGNAGDINGDGFDDLIIGAPSASDPHGYYDSTGESYVVFGRSSGFTASLNLADLNGSDGFVIGGIDSGNISDESVSSAGDVNGDGFDDLIIGAPFAGESDGYYGGTGESYVVFSNGGSFAASLNLAELDGSNGFVLRGIDRGDQAGDSVGSAGDVNGDGFDDLIIGAPFAGESDGYSVDRTGESYVVFGSDDGFASLNLAELDGNNGFAIRGSDAFAYLGKSLSRAGDINGDGFDDIIIGQSFLNNPRFGTFLEGASYVVFGKSDGFNASLSVTDLNGTNGFSIRGIETSDSTEVVVSGAGDFNGDGFDDVIIGTPAASLYDGPINPSKTYVGQSYVLFGSGNGFAPVVDLSALEEGDGLIIADTIADTRLGFSVGGAGDINGDGIDDVILGAPRASSGSSYSDYGGQGKSYVIFGTAPASSTLTGTNAADRLSGGSGADIISGLGGRDTLEGLAGDDDIAGGNGNDLVTAGAGDDTVAGDRGRDEIWGGEDDDSLDGGDGKDTIFAEAGNDTVMGGSGGDSLDGGEGNDAMSGGTGDDEILAGSGDDTVAGDNGRDEIFGGDGNDWLDGGTGSDSIFAEAGDDTVTGSDGRDTLSGGEGNDQMSGANGRDVMFGDGGDDTLAGGKDRDTLTGGLGNDMLYGEGGRDRLVGVDPLHTGDGIGCGAGEVDTLTGGSDRDTFVLGDATRVFYDDGDDLSSGASDFALVIDFQVKRDYVQLHGSAALYRLEFANADATLLFSLNDAAVGEVIAVFQSIPADLTLGDSAFSFV